MSSSVTPNYTESNIRSLEWNEHIRLRPGMYVGPHETAIYVLLKEAVDNSIDEFIMGCGKRITITITSNPDGSQTVTVRDFGRGIPLGSVVDCAGKPNTGGKYDDEAFQRSVGLNGIGLKAVNALSRECIIQSFREDQTRRVEFSRGVLVISFKMNL